jgi:predicted naringenin-chalcone synthase
MPEEVQKDFEEARTIVMQSPRGACALLRLAVQKLCSELGESGTNINDDIAALVQKGLSVEVQQALDSLRVIGNNAVHPGEMDLTDDTETASALFELLNFIVEDRISQPKKREEIFAKLPAKAVAAIQRRDGS